MEQVENFEEHSDTSDFSSARNDTTKTYQYTTPKSDLMAAEEIGMYSLEKDS